MLCNEESSYILHKWKPNHVIYDKSNGNLGKRILKIKNITFHLHALPMDTFFFVTFHYLKRVFGESKAKRTAL